MSGDTEATTDRLAEILALATSGALVELQAAVIALIDENERLRAENRELRMEASEAAIERGDLGESVPVAALRRAAVVETGEEPT